MYRPAQSLTIMNRKLKITELNRISTEEFKEAEKLPLVVVLDNIRSLHNIGSMLITLLKLLITSKTKAIRFTP